MSRPTLLVHAALLVLWASAAMAVPARVDSRELQQRFVGLTPGADDAQVRVAWLRIRDTRPAAAASDDEGRDLTLEVVVAALADLSSPLEVWPLGDLGEIGDGESIYRDPEERDADSKARAINRRLDAGGFRAFERLLGVSVAVDEASYRSIRGGFDAELGYERPDECRVRPRLRRAGEPDHPLPEMACPWGTSADAVDTVLTPGGDLLVLWEELWDWSGGFPVLTRIPWPEALERRAYASPTTLPQTAARCRGRARIRSFAPHLLGWSADGSRLAYVSAIHWEGPTAELALLVHDLRQDRPEGQLSLGWFPYREDDLVRPMHVPSSIRPLDPTFTRSRRSLAERWLRAEGFVVGRRWRKPLRAIWENGGGVFGEDYSAVSFVPVAPPWTGPDDRLIAVLTDVHTWQDGDYDDERRWFALYAVGNPRPIVDLRPGVPRPER